MGSTKFEAAGERVAVKQAHTFYGSTAEDQAVVLWDESVSGIVADAGVDAIHLAFDSNEITVSLDPNTLEVVLKNGETELARMAPQTDGTQIACANGTFYAHIGVDEEGNAVLGVSPTEDFNASSYAPAGEEYTPVAEDVDTSVTSESPAATPSTPDDPDQPAGPVDNATLAAALQELKDAQKAVSEYPSTLGEFDADCNPESDNSIEAGKATAADIAGYFTAAANGLDSIPLTTLAASDYLKLEKTDLQNADIATAEAAAQKAVDDAAAKAPAGATAMLENVSTLQEALHTQLKSENNVKAAFEDQTTAFESLFTDTVLDGVSVGASDGNVNFVDNKFGLLEAGVVKTVYAEKVDGAWKLTAEGANIKQFDAFAASYENTQAASTKTLQAQKALEDAVSEIVLAETGGYAVKSLGSAVSVVPAAGSESVTVDLTQNVTIYPTKADADAGEGIKETFKVEFKALASTDTASWGSASVTGADDDTTDSAAKVAVKFKAAFTDQSEWTVSGDGTDGTLTFVAVDPGNKTDVTETEFTGVTSVTVTKQGADAGNTDTAAAPNSDLLFDKLAEQKSLTEAVENYEEARGFASELKKLEDAVNDANSAITEDLGVNLVAADTFSAKDDVYLVDAKAGQPAIELSGFGESGVDKIFIGDSFEAPVVLDSTVKFGTDALGGDASAYDFFLQKSGSDVMLYIEAETFGGNSTSGSDIISIKLLGVESVDGLTFADGFLSAGEASA